MSDLDFDSVKVLLEGIGLSVYRMSFPIAVVGETEEGAKTLCAKCSRYRDKDQVKEAFQQLYSHGLRSVYLYQVIPADHSDKLIKIRAAWSIDVNGAVSNQV